MEQEKNQALVSQEESQKDHTPEAAPLGEGAYQFRGVAFGGFARHDVLDYLKKSEDAHAQKLLQLQQALTAAQERNTTLQARADELEQQSDTVGSRIAELQAALDRANAALTEQDRMQAQKESEAAALREKLAQLQDEVQALRPQAEAYERLKERAATIELDAHERAQRTMDGAAQESGRVRTEYARWLREVHTDYRELREEINVTFHRAAQELDRLCKAMERTGQDFDLHEDELRTLLQQAEGDSSQESDS